MNARDKIKGLTNAWYGFALVSSVVSLLKNGIGIFSLLSTVVGLGFMFVLTWFIGNRLLAKSSFTRILLMIISGLCSLLFTVGVAKMGWMFLHDWSFELIYGMLLGGTGAYMHVRSFRVLADSSVKAYVSGS